MPYLQIFEFGAERQLFLLDSKFFNEIFRNRALKYLNKVLFVANIGFLYLSNNLSLENQLIFGKIHVEKI